MDKNDAENRKRVAEALNYRPTDEDYAKAHSHIVYYGFSMAGIVVTLMLSNLIAESMDSILPALITAMVGAIFSVELASFIKDLAYGKFLDCE
ncbi:MAG: hypothetical protein AB1763_05820 [Campylobacterota bacterium]